MGREKTLFIRNDAQRLDIHTKSKENDITNVAMNITSLIRVI